MEFRIRAKLGNLEEVTRRLQTLARRIQKRILRKAVDQAGTIVLKAARQLVPVQTGLLKKSLGKKVKVYKSGAVVALIGPRSGFKRALVIREGEKIAVKKLKEGDVSVMDKEGKQLYQNPTKYAHLVEFGTYRSSAKPFLRPALENSKSLVVNTMSLVILNGINEEVRKGAASA